MEVEFKHNEINIEKNYFHKLSLSSNLNSIDILILGTDL